MKQELTITKAEKKTSKTNQQYLSVESDLGKFSCWNGAILDKLQVGHRYEVTSETVNGFNNILGIERDLGAVFNFTAALNAPGQTDKSSTMRESYAKDILLKMIDAAMVQKTQPDVVIMAEYAAQCVLKIRDIIAKG